MDAMELQYSIDLILMYLKYSILLEKSNLQFMESIPR